MVEQMAKNDSNDLEDKVRTLTEQNAKLMQILLSKGCPVDSLIHSESQSNVIQPINVVPLDSFSTFLTRQNNVYLPQNSTSNEISIRTKSILNDNSSNVETTTNLLDNNKHPRPIRPKPSIQHFNSLTLNETKPLLNNVLTPSSLINNTNSSTPIDEICPQTKKVSKNRTARIRKTTPIPIAPNLGRPLAPAPSNLQRIVTTNRRSSSHTNTSKKTRPNQTKTIVSRSPPTDRFAESISGLMKDFDQQLIAANFLSTPTTTNILSQTSTVNNDDDVEQITTLINEEEMRLVEMNFDETIFLKQFELDETTTLKPPTHSTYPGSSLINNNVFTTIVPLAMQNSLETNRNNSTRSLPEEGFQLTARHIEPSQVATYESTKYTDILDELVNVTDQDVMTHAQATTTNNDFALNLFERTDEFADLQCFYSNDDENSSPKSDVEPAITDLSSIIQIGQNRNSTVHRIVFEPILSPPMTTSSTEEKLIRPAVKTKIRKEKRRKSSSSNVEQMENEIPPTPGDYDETFSHQFHSTDDSMTKTTFITPPPDNENHEQKFSSSADEQFQNLKKSKKDHFDNSTTNSHYSVVVTPTSQHDPYAQTYPQYHSTNSSTPYFPYSFASPYVSGPPAASPFYPNFPQTSYNFQPNSNFMSSHDHHSYKR